MIDLFTNEFFLYLLAINMISALGMHIVYSTGQLNLGQVGFLAIGAYAAAVTDKVLGWPLAASLLASAVTAGVIALPIALGANRVRGIYLIMGTMAVGEIVQITIGNVDALGGLQGYSGITPVSLFEVVMVLLLVLAGTIALMSSPLGLQMRAIFDDENAAASAGVATRRVKVTAVVISAAVVGIAGGLTAKWLLFIAPRNFGVDVSFRIALFSLIGGVHTVLGPLAGAFMVTTLLELLRVLGSEPFMPDWLQWIGPWRLVIYGGLVMVLMAVRPEGLISRQWGVSLTAPWRRWLRAHQRAPVPVSERPKPATLPGDAAALLRLKNVSHHFGGLTALHNVSLSLTQGEVLALIGANGAGKTTLINVVCGRHSSQEGEIILAEKPIADFRPEARTWAGVARTFQTARTFAHLTVAEHIELGRLARSERPALPLEDILQLIGLTGKMDDLPERLTLGEQRRLEIGRAVASAPLLVFLDEPSVGMNEAERAELAALMRQVQRLGMAIVLVDHNLDLAFSLAERVVVLDFGQVIANGVPEDVVKDPVVQGAYLGQVEVPT